MAEKSSIDGVQKAENVSQSKKLSQKAIKEIFKKAKLKKKELGFKLLQAPTTGKNGDILIVTPKKSGTAVQRNLLRRRVKEIFRQEKLYKKPVISILIAYKQAMELNFENIKNFLVDNI